MGRTASLAALAALYACGGPQPQAPLPPFAAERQGLIERAADEQGVPRELLLALGWIDSRLSMHLGSPAADASCGLFPFFPDDPAAPASPRQRLVLSRAARLTGLDARAVCTDLFSNARAAAAVLRAEMDDLQAKYPDLRREELGDWYPAVMRLAGNDDALIADGYAAQVYRILRDGLDQIAPGGAPILIAAQAFSLAGRALRGDMNAAQNGDYCPSGACVAFVPASSSNFEVLREGAAIQYIVIHDMEGSYTGSIAYFQDPTADVSAHYLLQSSDGAITQMVHDVDTAWHTGNHAYNIGGIGIEHEGYAAEGTTWYTEAMYQSSAALTRWLSDSLSIPRDRNHIIGHYEVPDASHAGWYGGVNHHHDPCDAWVGDPTWHNNKACYWNWDHYMALVNGQSTGQTNGTLTGFVGDDCCGIAAATRKPLVGAAVTLSGTSLTATTDATGYYTFSVAPGTYTPTANMAGYISANHTSLGSGYPAALTVTAGQTQYGSIVLHKDVPVQTAPKVVIMTPADGTAAASSPITVSGSVDDTTLASVMIGTQTFPASAGAFSAQVALAAGVNAITVTATNAAGSGSATVHVSYAPPATGVTGHVRGTSAAPVAGAQLSLSPGALTAISAADGSYSFSAAPGNYTIAVAASGYQAFSGVAVIPADRILSLDLQLTASSVPPAPRVRIDTPAEGATFTVPLATVTGFALVPNLTALAIGDETITFDATFAFSAQAALVAGSNTLTVTATDAHGAKTTGSVTVVYAPPAAAGHSGCTEPGASLWMLAPALLLILRRKRANQTA